MITHFTTERHLLSFKKPGRNMFDILILQKHIRMSYFLGQI